MLPGRLRIAGPRRHETRREAGGRLQGSRPRLVRDGVELGDRMRSFVRAALLHGGAGNQLQRRRALRPILRGQMPEVPLGEIRAGLEIAAIEYHTRAPEGGEGMGSAALEQGHGFVELSLAPPQFSEAHEPLPRHGRAARRELIRG